MPRFLAMLVLALTPAALPAQWRDITPNSSFDGWENIGAGIWNVTSDNILIGERDRLNSKHQAWLYTRKDYRQFDLRFEYWLRHDSNSGISIRDTSRAAHACGDAHIGDKTPSHIGYEIQILAAKSEKNPTGSLYLFQDAKTGFEHFGDWNKMEIQVRDNLLTVLLNGHKVMEHPGDPNRPKSGPIGLQLHDPNTVVMFRHIELREIR
ncbi:MAG TPA: DUF1080 domain-containing protein [Bryobacteraceae bacterium]|nr:DUF1080 domain-containing protein [Bryobacteraceae bacterium]HPT24817.1 DUF1080 domain-containing protein [Bryobacteraceae bacterium]